MELNDLIAKYKEVRETREKYDAEFKEKLKTLQDEIEKQLAASGLKSARTDAGQAITSLRRSVKVSDWEQFEQFANAEYPSLVKTSIDSTEALRLIDENVAIPGTETTSTFVLTIK